MSLFQRVYKKTTTSKIDSCWIYHKVPIRTRKWFGMRQSHGAGMCQTQGAPKSSCVRVLSETKPQDYFP